MLFLAEEVYGIRHEFVFVLRDGFPDAAKTVCFPLLFFAVVIDGHLKLCSEDFFAGVS